LSRARIELSSAPETPTGIQPGEKTMKFAKAVFVASLATFAFGTIGCDSKKEEPKKEEKKAEEKKEEKK
jgi:hypothetical protein